MSRADARLEEHIHTLAGQAECRNPTNCTVSGFIRIVHLLCFHER